MRGNVWNTPWKVGNEVRRLLWTPFTRGYFALHGVRWGQGWRIYGFPLVQRYRGSEMTIGDSFQMRNWFSSNPLGVNHRSILATWSPEAMIVIGDEVGMTGATICAQTLVQIGSRVRIGANSTISDTDFHPLDADDRIVDPRAGTTKAVIVEDDVFIGMQVLILKGTHIGQGSVVGAGSVVVGEIPPYSIVAGNPARIVRELTPASTIHSQK